MPKFKVRRPALFPQGITNGNFSTDSNGKVTVGTVGTALGTLMFGSASVAVPVLAGASSGSATVTIANLPSDALVFVSTASMAACCMITGTSAISASVLQFKFYNSGSVATGGVLNTNFNYIAVKST